MGWARLGCRQPSCHGKDFPGSFTCAASRGWSRRMQAPPRCVSKPTTSALVSPSQTCPLGCSVPSLDILLASPLSPLNLASGEIAGGP